MTAVPSLPRLPSVDALRGLVMIIMALDHTRDFFHQGAMSFSPEDLTRTTAALFFTRWITHFCAPVFMFTAGLAAFLWLRPGRTTTDLSKYLWKRGLLLVLLELTALRFAIFFSLTNPVVLLIVLWALGMSMVILGCLVRLPIRVVAALSVIVIAGHNLLDPIDGGWWWKVLHRPGVFEVGGVPVMVGYPLVPWFAVMAAGYCFGPVLSMAAEVRRAVMLRAGLGMTGLFVVLRFVNVYGDPSRWANDPPGMALLSFLRVAKYPPSLDFVLMTLGPALVVLAWFERLSWKPANPLIVFGRTPLFYFLGHFFLAHLLAFPAALLAYGKAAFLLRPMPSMGGDAALYPPGFGYSLPVVYGVWLLVVAIMYPLCVWFGKRFGKRRV